MSEDIQEDLECERCGRGATLCVCDHITPIKARTRILVLQHPQEPGVDIGTAAIIGQLFPEAIIKTGLSWANLKRALGSELGAEIEPSRWGVLYLGSVRTEELPKDRTLFVVDRKGVALVEQEEALKGIKGIVLLDGTWSQAKTLWWRNAWLLKLKRLVLRRDKRSLYDQIRREPRRGCLSSLETLGEVLSVLESRGDIISGVETPLKELVSRCRVRNRNSVRRRGLGRGGLGRRGRYGRGG
jgi:DTW domain-containing protein YfiP